MIVKKNSALIVGNWKAFIESPKAGLTLLKAIDKSLPRGMKSTVVVCPPALLVAYLRCMYQGKRIALGVQDISLASQGAHTGEVTAELARASGATYVIVGHAERRASGESSEQVAGEARAALDAGLKPIICVGESERDKQGAFFSNIEKMLAESVARLDAKELGKVVIAYEPVWAIGAATPPDARVVQEAIIYIRKTLVALFGREAALKVKIIYGGAVEEDSAGELLTAGQAQGFLVGRASVDHQNFAGIIRACER